MAKFISGLKKHEGGLDDKHTMKFAGIKNLREKPMATQK